MSHMFSYIRNMPKIQAKINIGSILIIVFTFDSFLLQSDGKQGRDEQVGQYLTNRRNKIDNNEEEENYDDINILFSGEPQPERHLVSHKADGRNKQAGPAGDDDIKMSPKSIGFILDSDSEHFYSGAGSPQRPLGW